MRKVIGVGFARTGTSTLRVACQKLGYTRCKSWDRNLYDAYDRGDIELLLNAAACYDVLEDWPWPLIYKELFQEFPHALFVLTRRRSADIWLESLLKFHKRKGGSQSQMERLLYGASMEDAGPEYFKNRYISHNNAVRNHFADADNFVEVCWAEGDGWDALCNPLDLQVPNEPFPHTNKTPTFRAQIQSKLRRILASVRHPFT